MFIKVVTTALVVLGVAMLIGLPFVFRGRPVEGDQEALARYGTWLLAYFGATSLVWLSAAFSAVFVMRSIKKKLVDEQKQNLKGMIEGTQRDHERKQ